VKRNRKNLPCSIEIAVQEYVSILKDLKALGDHEADFKEEKKKGLLKRSEKQKWKKGLNATRKRIDRQLTEVFSGMTPEEVKAVKESEAVKEFTSRVPMEVKPLTIEDLQEVMGGDDVRRTAMEKREVQGNSALIEENAKLLKGFGSRKKMPPSMSGHKSDCGPSY